MGLGPSFPPVLDVVPPQLRTSTASFNLSVIPVHDNLVFAYLSLLDFSEQDLVPIVSLVLAHSEPINICKWLNE
jgi:hypothetical protein